MSTVITAEVWKICQWRSRPKKSRGKRNSWKAVNVWVKELKVSIHTRHYYYMKYYIREITVIHNYIFYCHQLNLSAVDVNLLVWSQPAKWYAHGIWPVCRKKRLLTKSFLVMFLFIFLLFIRKAATFVERILISALIFDKIWL